VFDWFKRLSSGARKFTLPARVERTARNTSEVNLKPYTPEPKVFLGQLAYLQLSHSSTPQTPNTRQSYLRRPQKASKNIVQFQKRFQAWA
jgi:hypothetical protein